MACSNCSSSPCCCVSSTPYFVSTAVCSEDHAEEVILNQFQYGVCPSESWNIPQCGQASVLSVPGVVGITIGASIWHPVYGYYEILAINADAGQITISNPCLTENAAAGVQVPACTCFTVTPPSCCADTDNLDGVFVAFDFTAPADGDCIDITLTSVEGLIVPNNVQIGSGVYGLEEIKANNVVTICNNGEGITPGTPVVAKNQFGFYQYPVQLLAVNPCSQSTVASGSVLACDGDSSAPLTGTVIGQVLTLTNVTTGAAAYATPAAVPTYSSVLLTHTSAPITPTTIGTATPSYASNIAGVTVTNPSASATMKTIYTVTGVILGERTIPTAADWLELSMSLQVRFNGGGWNVQQTVAHSWEFVDIDPLPEGFQVVWTGIRTVAISSADLIEARIEIQALTAAVTAAFYDIASMSIQIAAYGSTV